MSKKKFKIGYTTGVFDMFHIGHLNILKKAKKMCDYLIVGVSSDSIVLRFKHKVPVIPFEDRAAIVKSIKYVDRVVAQNDYSIDGKINAVKRLKADALFVGDDWKNTEKWNEIEKQLKPIGCNVIYLPRTKGISSSELRNELDKKGSEKSNK